MGTLIKQEVYKQFHKGGWLIATFIMVLGQVGFGIFGKIKPKWFPAGALVSEDYIMGEIVIFIAIAATASIVSMEYQYGTMKQLLYRQYYRSQVFVSKIITVLFQLAFLQVVACATTFILTLILHPSFDWMAKAGGVTTLQTYFKSIGGNLLVDLLLLSVVLLLSTLFKSNAAAIATGLVGYFLITLAATLLLLAIHQWHVLKWNPFTFLLVGQQIQDPSLAHSTFMSTETMIAGTLVYTVIFGFIAYLSFRKRSI